MRDIEYGSEEYLAMRERDIAIAEYMGWERWTCGDYEYKSSALFPPGANPSSWRKVGKEVPLAEGYQDAPRYHQDSTTSFDLVRRFRMSLWFEPSHGAYIAASVDDTNRVVSEYAEDAVARLAFALIIKEEIERELNNVNYILKLREGVYFQAPFFMNEDEADRVIQSAMTKLLPEHFTIERIGKKDPEQGIDKNH